MSLALQEILAYHSLEFPKTEVIITVTRPTHVATITIVGGMWTFATTASETAPNSTVRYALETAAITTQLEQPNTTSVSPPRNHSIRSLHSRNSPALTTTTPPPLAGLPLPTTIGIGVGAGVWVIVLTALAFFLWRRKRKQRRRSEPPPADELQLSMPVKPDKYLYVAKHHELYGQQPERYLGAAEMPVPQYFAELDASGRERT
ncbi:hypothetical protein LX32DRAFT_603476 [Colletotrichum zoysiae]|uniref:Uncharacterized protein n=1 Tax=Colletotrichum zoysiae TaxID=1216348 RepID=A0AAD9H5Y8_9PEZI|nr:hypothetical protein LX32DRAFT_603476 [Colletotrichum zoysiae]